MRSRRLGASRLSLYETSRKDTVCLLDRPHSPSFTVAHGDNLQPFDDEDAFRRYHPCSARVLRCSPTCHLGCLVRPMNHHPHNPLPFHARVHSHTTTSPSTPTRRRRPVKPHTTHDQASFISNDLRILADLVSALCIFQVFQSRTQSLIFLHR